MKRMIVFVLLVGFLLPSTALAAWETSGESADAGASFTLDEPAPESGKPAPGGGYFLGDGPTIILPEEHPVTQASAPSPPVTPAPTEQHEEKPAPTINPAPTLAIQGKYEKGSVYGPRLTVKQLREVKSAVQEALSASIREGMSDKEKLIALVDYLCDACVYADSYNGNANNAYGALIEGKAQCSGYARSFKALCDGAGIGCYYVHAAKDDPVNPSHQWCMVEYGGAWYHLDPQMIDDTIRFVNGKATYPRPITLMASHLSYNEKGLPQTAKRSVTLR